MALFSLRGLMNPGPSQEKKRTGKRRDFGEQLSTV